MHWEPADDSAYAYLLGWYLGDGYLGNTGRAYQLLITADLAYLEIVMECRAAIIATVPGTATSQFRTATASRC